MPTKRYINGSGKFQINLIDTAGNTEELNFSFRYQALKEYDQTKITKHNFRDGSKNMKPHYVLLWWKIDFSGLLDTDQGLINKVKNAKFENKTIWLIPHIDVPQRSFNVLLMEDERRELGQYYNDRQDGANKDYILWFENAERQERHNWVDPDDIPVIASNELLIIT